MDTDELSNEAYKAVIIESERFHHDLTLQFGIMSSDCLDEDDFLEKATQLIEEFMTYRSEDLPDIFFDDRPKLNT